LGQGDVLLRNMSRGQSVGDWNIQIANHSHDDLLQRITLTRRRPAVEHLAEDDTAYFRKLPRQLQMHQHAINLIWLGADVLDENEGAVGVNPPGRPQRDTQNKKPPAIKSSFGRS